MNRRLIFLGGVVVCLISFVSRLESGQSAGAAAAGKIPVAGPASTGVTNAEQISRTLQGASLMFIENAGQFDEGARFQLRGGLGSIWLAEDAIWVTLLAPAEDRRGYLDGRPLHMSGGEQLDRLAGPTPQAAIRHGVNLRLTFVGANPEPVLEAFNPLTTTVSYFIGKDPNRWQPAVPVWGGVRYTSLYPGLDLELSGPKGTLSTRLICRAADCQALLEGIRLQVEGATGLALVGDELYVKTTVGDFRLPLLQVVDATGLPVEGSGRAFVTAGTIISAPFASGGAQSPAPNLHSPDDNPADLLYSTFLGGTGQDNLSDVAVDEAGSAYVTGYSDSPDFPTTPGAFDTSNEGSADAFVAKLNPTGSDLVYATFLGGSSTTDSGNSLAVDSVGSVYVAGVTASDDFPATPGAFDSSCGSDHLCGGFASDGFVAMLNPAGSDLVYATFLGGDDYDFLFDLAVDDLGSAYVTGRTESFDFPTTPGAFDTKYPGYIDAFVAKINPNGSDLVYSTFLGDSGYDVANSLAVDGAGRAYVTGFTDSPDFPTTPGAFDTIHNGDSGISDAFVVLLNPAGSDLVYATFLGGSSTDYGKSLAVDSAGSAYVTGVTASNDFPTTPGAFIPEYQNSFDAFVTKIDPAGSDLVYSTFLGGSFRDEGNSLAVDEAGSAYVTGYTISDDFPTTPGAFDTICGSDFLCGIFPYVPDAFVAKLNPTASDLVYATFLGSDLADGAGPIAVDSTGIAYVTGITGSPDFPTTPGAFDTIHNGGVDAFLAKLACENQTENQTLRLFLPFLGRY